VGGWGSSGLLPLTTLGRRRRHPTGCVRASLGRSCNDKELLLLLLPSSCESVERRIDHTAPCGLNVSRQSSNMWPPRGLNTSNRSIVVIHAWGYGVGFDTLYFFGRFGGTSLGPHACFIPPQWRCRVRSRTAVRVGGPGQGHLFGMRPSPLSLGGCWAACNLH